MKNYIIGVDIGGTKIAAGVLSKSGKLIRSVTIATEANKGKSHSIKRVFLAIDTIIKEAGIRKKDILGIGVCAPGPLDFRKGMIHNPPNMPGWKNVALGNIIRNKYKIPVKLENDANAAGLAETIWGAANGYKYVLYVTVSTGIGTGIIIGGKIYHGKNGLAGEGGHVIINYDAKSNSWGCREAGCIESYASGTGTANHLKNYLRKNRSLGSAYGLARDDGDGKRIIELVGGDINKITMETISMAAKQKDPLAIKTIEKQAELLGVWLGSMINVLDPEVVVIGGGVSMIGDLLFKKIRKTIPKKSINVFAAKTPVIPAKLKKDVGIFGAASLFVV